MEFRETIEIPEPRYKAINTALAEDGFEGDYKITSQGYYLYSFRRNDDGSMVHLLLRRVKDLDRIRVETFSTDEEAGCHLIINALNMDSPHMTYRDIKIPILEIKELHLGPEPSVITPGHYRFLADYLYLNGSILEGVSTTHSRPTWKEGEGGQFYISNSHIRHSTLLDYDQSPIMVSDSSVTSSVIVSTQNSDTRIGHCVLSGSDKTSLIVLGEQMIKTVILPEDMETHYLILDQKHAHGQFPYDLPYDPEDHHKTIRTEAAYTQLETLDGESLVHVVVGPNGDQHSITLSLEAIAESDFAHLIPHRYISIEPLDERTKDRIKAYSFDRKAIMRKVMEKISDMELMDLV